MHQIIHSQIHSKVNLPEIEPSQECAATERILLNTADNSLQEQRHKLATHMTSIHYTAANNRKCLIQKL